MECGSKSDTGNSRGDWNHFKIRKNLSNIPGKHEIRELQTKKKPFWSLHTFYAKCKHRSTKQCSTTYPRNMVYFRYIIVNTVHKGNNQDNNNNNNLVVVVVVLVVEEEEAQGPGRGGGAL